MALDQKKLQKKRAKRDQKRRQAKALTAGSGGSMPVSRAWANACQAPIEDVFAPTDLFELGMGSIWISRRLADGRYAVAAFLLDVLCLGVKDALYKIAEAAEYPQILARVQADSAEGLERLHPSCARKLVEGALAYAGDLGFEAHEDYRVARIIFGDVDASACPTSFTFGREGKPFYINGPSETPAMRRRILKRLEQRCGPGGYDFLVADDILDLS